MPSSRPRARLQCLDAVSEAILWNVLVASLDLGEDEQRVFIEYARSPTLQRLVAQAYPNLWKKARRRRRDPQSGDEEMYAVHEAHGRSAELLSRYARERGRAPVPVPEPGDPLRRNLATIQEAVGASDAEMRLVLFALVGRMEPVACCTDFFDYDFSRGSTAEVPLVAAALGLEHSEVVKVLAPASPLSRTGLLVLNEHHLPRHERLLEFDPRLYETVFDPALTRDAFVSRFIEIASAPELSLADFPALARDLERVAGLLRQAMASGSLGVNALFWGPTGTGKTECARIVARLAGARLYQAGTADRHGESPTPRQRLGSGVLGNRILNPADCVLLFDEMDDVAGSTQGFRGLPRQFRHFDRRDDGLQPDGSKQWLNLHLESNRVATLWTVNDPREFDPALRRRFAYVLEFPPLDVEQRRRVLTRHLSPLARVSPEEAEAIAARFPLSAAHLASAVRSARLVAGAEPEDAETLHAVLEQHHRMELGEPPPRRESGCERFLVEAVHCPVDVRVVADQIVSWKPDGKGPGISLCLYGPPGTGKTEFVRHVAARAHRRVIAHRVSDIQSCWVGETEKRIAAAFREAERDDTLLLFDEADSFLRGRERAQHSWEITFVNEFLQHLDSFRGVVACTTNLFRELDPACLRRFTFKLPFLAPRPAQCALLFRQLFAGLLSDALAPDEEMTARLAAVPGLAAGDFAVVARRLRILGRKVSVAEAVRELVAEVAVKESTPKPIGFGSLGPCVAQKDDARN